MLKFRTFFLNCQWNSSSVFWETPCIQSVCIHLNWHIPIKQRSQFKYSVQRRFLKFIFATDLILYMKSMFLFYDVSIDEFQSNRQTWQLHRIIQRRVYVIILFIANVFFVQYIINSSSGFIGIVCVCVRVRAYTLCVWWIGCFL